MQIFQVQSVNTLVHCMFFELYQSRKIKFIFRKWFFCTAKQNKNTIVRHFLTYFFRYIRTYFHWLYRNVPFQHRNSAMKNELIWTTSCIHRPEKKLIEWSHFQFFFFSPAPVSYSKCETVLRCKLFRAFGLSKMKRHRMSYLAHECESVVLVCRTWIAILSYKGRWYTWRLPQLRDTECKNLRETTRYRIKSNRFFFLAPTANIGYINCTSNGKYSFCLHTQFVYIDLIEKVLLSPEHTWIGTTSSTFIGFVGTWMENTESVNKVALNSPQDESNNMAKSMSLWRESVSRKRSKHLTAYTQKWMHHISHIETTKPISFAIKMTKNLPSIK